MAWETRERGSRYYYRSVRGADGKVRREYIGSGPDAERIAEQDQRERKHRQQQRDEIKSLESTLAAAERNLDKLADCNDQILAASLLAAGYHFHRGEWRRKRDEKNKQ